MSHFFSELPRQLVFTLAFTIAVAVVFAICYFVIYKLLLKKDGKFSNKSICLLTLITANVGFIAFFMVNTGVALNPEFSMGMYNYLFMGNAQTVRFDLLMSIFAFLPLGILCMAFSKRARTLKGAIIIGLSVPVAMQIFSLVAVRCFRVDLAINGIIGIALGFMLYFVTTKLLTINAKRSKA